MVKLSSLLLGCLFSLNASAFAAQSSYFQLFVEHDAAGTSHYNLQPLSQFAACKGKICKDLELVLPASCTWECQNGILSGQGTAVVKGVLSRPEGESKAQFQVEAGFDTWRARPLPSPLLKITSTDAHCKGSSCFGHFISENLKTGKKIALQQLLFDKADDVNYKLEAARALASLTSKDGLLVTGKLQSTKLAVAYVFRTWVSEASCDPLATLKADVIPQGEVDPLFAIIADESEASQAPEDKPFYWAMLLEEKPEALIYRTGINDLWAQVISIDRSTCEIKILAEH